ncbi:MAG: flavodoxin family protein [Acidimicrobiia bacterium]|nr:flavodoxin family protein [Acidimicrobiia bacterium]
MNVVVLYQSRSRKANTRRLAEMIGNTALQLGADASMWPVTNVDLARLAEADLVFVGTWTDGVVVGGHRPGQTGKLAKLPAIYDKKTAAFMTYAIHAGKVIDAFAGWLQRNKGADVVAAKAFRNRDTTDEAVHQFVVDAFESVGVTVSA